MAVEKIQVVGAGQMGSGIVQVVAQAGLSVNDDSVPDLRSGESVPDVGAGTGAVQTTTPFE